MRFVRGEPVALAGMLSVLLKNGRTSGYGYLWWLGRESVGDRDIDWVGAEGYGGQRLYVVPSLDLVVVVTAGVYRRSYAQGLAGTTALDMALLAAVKH